MLEAGNQKTIQLKVRVSPEEKEVIMNYCNKNGLNISDFLRKGIQLLIQEDK